MIYRDFGPADLAVEAHGVPLAGTILVQSQPTDADTDWMLALAEAEPMISAVVGWVDLAAANAVERIRSLAGKTKLRGLRPMLQSLPQTDWLLEPTLAPAIEAMIDARLRFDALVQPRHLAMLAQFVRRWPELPLVIDHAAKPDAAHAMSERWRDEIAELAALGAHCKLSGLRTEQARGQHVDGLVPYVEHLVASFGNRLMWGSDWPVLLLSGDGWRRWHDDALRLATDAGADCARLFHGAATDFYAIGDQR
jgi:L-fuconolactonase